MENEIHACPWCNHPVPWVEVKESELGHYHVWCGFCGARGPASTKNSVVIHWNLAATQFKGVARNPSSARSAPKQKGEWEQKYISETGKNLSMTQERIEKWGNDRESVARGLLKNLAATKENLNTEPEIPANFDVLAC